MSKLTLDLSVSDSLRAANEPVTLLDPQGQIVGVFVPPRYEWRSGPEVSDEELERRAQSRTGRTLKEIMADLEKVP